MPRKVKGPEDPVTEWDVRRYRMLKNFNAMIGKDDPTDEEVIEFIRRSRAKKIAKAKSDKRKQGEPKRIESRRKKNVERKTNSTMDERFAEYLKTFIPETPNDVAMVKQLISIELRLDEIATYRKGVDDTKALQQLAQEEKSLRSEFREYQRSMLLDKRGRHDMKADRSAMDIIQDIIVESKAFRDKEMPNIICPKCHSELAWLWINFKELPFELTLTCGCGNRVVINTLGGF